MKIIHTADWHIGKNLNDYSLLEDQRYYFQHFLDRLDQIRPDALIIAGDLFDRSVPSAEAVELLNQILSRIILDLQIAVFLIPGNHDSRERLGFMSGLLSQSRLYIASEIGQNILTVPFISGSVKVNFYLLPYIEPHQIKRLYPEKKIQTAQEAMEAYTEKMLSELNSNEINLLMAHGFFSCGSLSEEESSVGGSDLVNISSFLSFDYVALGHLHSPRKVNGEHIRYSGSPLKYSIDEALQKKSFTVIDIQSKNEIEVSTESLSPLRDLRVLEGSFAYFTDRQNHQNTDDYVFINLTDKECILNVAARLKSIFPNLLGLRYLSQRRGSENQLISEEKKTAFFSDSDLFDHFYQKVTGEALSSEEKNYVREVFTTALHDKKTGEDHDSDSFDL